MLTGVVICIAYIFVSMYVVSVKSVKLLGIPNPYVTVLIVSRLMHWLCLILMIRYALKIEKQPLLLWENHNYKAYTVIFHIILIWLAIIIVMTPVSLLLKAYGAYKVSPMIKIVKSIVSNHRLLIPFTVITAGIVEEYLFRGYIQPRLELVLKNAFASIFITSLLFAAVHIGYGTLGNVIGPFVIGLIFSVYYWKYRNIYTLMICHILIDWLAMSRI